MSGALAVGKEFVAFGVAIFHKQLTARLGKVEERYVKFLGKLLHLPAEIHRVVIGRY